MFDPKSYFDSERVLVSNSRITGINAWTAVYVGMVVLISLLPVQFNAAFFTLYFILAIPFLNHIEHYVAITLLLSTISYYFVGAGGGLWSMATILLLLIILRIFLFKKGKVSINKKNIGSIVFLGCIATFSYMRSPYDYTNGWLGLLYVLIVTLVIGNYEVLDLEQLVHALFVVAYTLVIGYFLTVAISGLFVDGRLTITNEVNTNTFGKSCAQLATIFAIGAIIYHENRIKNIIFCLAISVLSMLTGSRGSLIAFIMATVLISVIYAYRNHVLTGTVFRIVVLGVVLLFLFGSFGTMMDLDISRFKWSGLIGSRRLLIYQYVPPYVFNNNYWILGYGPGHDCSRQAIRSLIGWDFAHTHNTFLEAFCELGVFGLIPTLICTFSSVKAISKTSGISRDGYIIFALLVCLLINSLAESFFCNFVFWCLLAICRQKYEMIQSE